jgi:hypothetical protein
MGGRRKACYAVFTLAALAALAACTGGPASSTGAAASPSTAHGKMATEVIEGSATIIHSASVTLKASGVFVDGGILKLPIGDPRTFAFRFNRGDLVVLNATGPTSGPLRLNKTTCAFSRSLSGTFRVLSGNSTGLYVGATGHGVYVFNSGGVAPKTPNGTCDTGSRAAAAKVLTVLLRGPVLLNAQN